MSLNRRRPYLAATPAFAAGTASPRTFLEDCIAQIETHEGDVQAFVHMNLDAARKAADASAARWKNGKPLSIYDGMPVGVKDIIETEDFPTEMGSPIYKNWESGRDAAVVKALRTAGTVIVGKTVTTEFASSHPNKTRNPHDLTRTPGGSSSGSAAGVGAGFISAGLGTQVVGSILRPAAFCGVFGYKPSLGGINRGGSHDFLSQSCTGTLAASLEDAWVLARDLAWRAGGDPGFPGISGPERLPPAKMPTSLIVLETPGWPIVDAMAKTALEKTCEHLSAKGIKILSRHTTPHVELVEKLLERSMPLTRLINAFESRWPYNVYHDKAAHLLSESAADRVVEAFELTLDDYRAALMERESIRATFNTLSGIADACITLSSSGAPPVGFETTGDPIFVVAGSMLGVPAVTLPVLESEGLPLGLQMLGFLNQDATLIAHASALLDQMTPK